MSSILYTMTASGSVTSTCKVNRKHKDTINVYAYKNMPHGLRSLALPNGLSSGYDLIEQNILLIEYYFEN